MAKKSVATFQTGGGKKFTRCVKMVKSKKSNSYCFRDEIVPNDKTQDFFKEDK